MNANHVLALERDMSTLVHLSQFAPSLLADTSAMPDNAGTVASRSKAALLGFLPGFRNFMVALEKADPAAADQVIAGFEALEDQEQPPAAVEASREGSSAIQPPTSSDAISLKLAATTGSHQVPSETPEQERRRLLGM